MNRIDATDLTGISETLLVTAYMRSLETRSKGGIIKDDKSVEMVKRIDYDFSKYNSPTNQTLIAIRTKIIDEVVSDFIARYPQATVINLGAGLCSRFFRLDNGSIQWIDLDLPQVEPIWNTLIGGSERHHYLACSILDLDWMNKVRKLSTGKILAIAEGLLMFLSETEVKYLIGNMSCNLPNSEFIFDSLGVLLAENSRLNSNALKINAAYRWGIDNLFEMESWGWETKLIDQWHYLDRYKSRLSWLSLLSYIPKLRRQVKIGHLRFSG